MRDISHTRVPPSLAKLPVHVTPRRHQGWLDSLMSRPLASTLWFRFVPVASPIAFLLSLSPYQDLPSILLVDVPMVCLLLLRVSAESYTSARYLSPRRAMYVKELTQEKWQLSPNMHVGYPPSLVVVKHLSHTALDTLSSKLNNDCTLLIKNISLINATIAHPRHENSIKYSRSTNFSGNTFMFVNTVTSERSEKIARHLILSELFR